MSKARFSTICQPGFVTSNNFPWCFTLGHLSLEIRKTAVEQHYSMACFSFWQGPGRWRTSHCSHPNAQVTWMQRNWFLLQYPPLLPGPFTTSLSLWLCYHQWVWKKWEGAQYCVTMGIPHLSFIYVPAVCLSNLGLRPWNHDFFVCSLFSILWMWITEMPKTRALIVDTFTL
jgi:hypothetical protein